jgi:hypothetical protein
MPAGFNPVLDAVIGCHGPEKKGQVIAVGYLHLQDAGCKSHQAYQGQGYVDTGLDIPIENLAWQVHFPKVAKVLISAFSG